MITMISPVVHPHWDNRSQVVLPGSRRALLCLSAVPSSAKGEASLWGVYQWLHTPNKVIWLVVWKMFYFSRYTE